MKELTERQQQLYDYYTDKRNWKVSPPSLRECAVFLGVASQNSVLKHLDAIRAKGYPLTINDGKIHE